MGYNDIEIIKDKALFNKSPYGNDKNVVMVKFSDGFLWLPSYKQLAEIINALEDIEKESWCD